MGVPFAMSVRRAQRSKSPVCRARVEALVAALSEGVPRWCQPGPVLNTHRFFWRRFFWAVFCRM